MWILFYLGVDVPEPPQLIGEMGHWILIVGYPTLESIAKLAIEPVFEFVIPHPWPAQRVELFHSIVKTHKVGRAVGG